VRYRLQVHTVDVEVDPGELGSAAVQRVLARFEQRYGELYGQSALLAGGGLELETHRVVGTRALERLGLHEHEPAGPDALAAVTGERDVYFEPDGFRPTPVYDGDRLLCGNVVAGPAIVQRMGDSVVIPPGCDGVLDRYLTLRLQPAADLDRGAAIARETEALR
jgi:N-methylhydantoinase A